MKEEKCEGWCRNTNMAFTVVNHVEPGRTPGLHAKREYLQWCPEKGGGGCNVLLAMRRESP